MMPRGASLSDSYNFINDFYFIKVLLLLILLIFFFPVWMHVNIYADTKLARTDNEKKGENKLHR